MRLAFQSPYRHLISQLFLLSFLINLLFVPIVSHNIKLLLLIASTNTLEKSLFTLGKLQCQVNSPLCVRSSGKPPGKSNGFSENRASMELQTHFLSSDGFCWCCSFYGGILVGGTGTLFCPFHHCHLKSLILVPFLCSWLYWQSLQFSLLFCFVFSTGG